MRTLLMRTSDRCEITHQFAFIQSLDSAPGGQPTDLLIPVGTCRRDRSPNGGPGGSGTVPPIFDLNESFRFGKSGRHREQQFPPAASYRVTPQAFRREGAARRQKRSMQVLILPARPSGGFVWEMTLEFQCDSRKVRAR